MSVKKFGHEVYLSFHVAGEEVAAHPSFHVVGEEVWA
jgi:hypothetical protein